MLNVTRSFEMLTDFNYAYVDENYLLNRSFKTTFKQLLLNESVDLFTFPLVKSSLIILIAET